MVILWFKVLFAHQHTADDIRDDFFKESTDIYFLLFPFAVSSGDHLLTHMETLPFTHSFVKQFP